MPELPDKPEKEKKPEKIKVKTDLVWGMVFYLTNDTEQLPHLLVGVVLNPGDILRFRLSFCGEVCEVFDFEASTERDLSMIEKFDEDV